MRKLFSGILRRLGYYANSLSKRIYRPAQETRTEKWNEANKKNNLREEYELNENSVVVDVGGFKGDWASNIYSRYQPTIFVFEPLKEFCEYLNKRFKQNNKIKIEAVGLAKHNEESKINVDGDKSSTLLSDRDKQSISLKQASEYFKKLGINHIDLIKINIEGGEYDLLEDLIESGYINNVDNLQIQFHDFVVNAKERMESIKNKLSLTHHTTYEHFFVWENWKINKK